MWQTIELREIRVFLVLAEERHFGRTAERLGLTQSRVSQSLRGLERKLGEQLVHRTSRRVTLTPRGERFRDEAGAAYEQLAAVLRAAHKASRSLTGTLRAGLLNAASGGPHLITIISAFETRHPGCDVEVIELPVRDRFEPLRGGQIDVMATRLPLEQPDLTVGPILSQEPRVLAVARDHPLAARADVSIEDIADYHVMAVGDLFPQELAEAFIPPKTPSGRPVRRVRVSIKDLNELIILIARGKIVHPTVPSFASYFGHPNLVYLPITDLPPSKNALVWRRRDSNPRLRGFIDVAREILRTRPDAAHR